MKSLKAYDNKFFIYEVDGQFVASESIGWFITYNYYKNWVNNLSAWAYKPKLGDIILDIGAGLGEESIVFSKMVGEKGRVFSIEANPEVFIVLQDVIRLNKLKNVKLFAEAINGTDEKVKFSVASNSFIGGGIGANYKDNTEFEIPGIRMDSFISRENLQNIDLLKVNIEGAERFVIDSVGDAIALIKNVAISCHDFRYRHDKNEFFRTRALVETYLIDNNFEIVPDKGDREFDDWVYAFNKKNT